MQHITKRKCTLQHLFIMLQDLPNLPEKEKVNAEASELPNHLSQGLDTRQLEHHSLEKRSHSHSESILFKILQFVSLGHLWISQNTDEKQQKKITDRKAQSWSEERRFNKLYKTYFKKLRIQLFSTEARIPQQVLKIKCINLILIEIC